MAVRKNIQGTLLLAFLHTTTFWTLGSCSTCDTPDDWLLADTESNQLNGNASHFKKIWPRGIVIYKLHPSLTLKDTSEIQKAFDEYRNKTCITFKPWQEGDTDFVSIEVDHDVCGFANVCKIGGAQVAKFGKNCRNMATMVHQLGHTLCLGHEHQRFDRDRFLNYSSCSIFPNKTESMTGPLGIYDYNSQMHYKCNSCDGGFPTDDQRSDFGYSVQVCGPDVAPGLSVLDADKINSLYNCQGCKRHRWVPAASLSEAEYGNMHTFGYEKPDGSPLYTCRALYKAEVVAGMYNPFSKTCKIASNYGVEEADQVEVLTIPGGLVGSDCSVYKLLNREDVSLKTLVHVGNKAMRQLHDENQDRNFTSHAAYSTSNWDAEKFIGNWWVISGRMDHTVYFAVGNGTRSFDFMALTCDFDTTCMLQKLIATQSSCPRNS